MKSKSLISYIDSLIFESKQVGVVYHFTKIKALESILLNDVLFSDRKEGISTTRSYNAKDTEFEWYPVRIVLDGNKISSNFKIVPFLYGFEENSYHPAISKNQYKNEREELIKTNSIDNVSKYIIQIDIDAGKYYIESLQRGYSNLVINNVAIQNRKPVKF